MQLPPSLRAFIAEVLLDTLDFDENFLVSSAWQEEILKRCAAKFCLYPPFHRW